MCLVLSVFFTSGFQNKDKSDSRIWPEGETATESLETILKKAWYIRQSAPDSALMLLNEATKQARKDRDSNSLVTALIRKGVVQKEMGEPKEAALLFKEAEALAERMKDSLALGRVLINIGQNEKLRGDFDAALENTLKAIVIFETYEQDAYVKVAYATLASTHIHLGQYLKSIKYYKRLLELAQAERDTMGLAISLQNLGTAYFYNSSLDTALQYQQKALLLAEILGNEIIETQVNNGIGSIYFEQGYRDQALQYFKKVEKQSKELGLLFEEVKVLNNLAAVYELRKDWGRATEYYHKAAWLATKIGDQTALKGLFLNLSQTFEAQGQFDSALIYYQKQGVIKDSLINVQSNRQIAEMQEKYESAKKDQEIAQLSRIEAEQQSDLQQRNFWLVGAGLAAILLLIALINYLSKLRTEKALAKRTAQLHQQKTMQLINEYSEKSMKAYLQGETTERQRLGEQLHDQLGSQLATVKLYYDQITGKAADEVQIQQLHKANAILSQACVDVRHFAHNLAADTLTEFGLETAVTDLCKTITDSGQLQVRLLCVGMDTRLPATVEMVVFRSIQELLTNAIKHADANVLHVRIKGDTNSLTVRIKDDGKGFNTELIQGSKGLGLATISQRIKTIKGQFDVVSSSTSGTQVDFELPLESPQKVDQ